MRKLAIGLCLSISLATVYAYAAPKVRLPSRVQLLGFTEQRVTGGTFELASACEAEFPGSRVCTPRDLMRTISVPESVANLDPEDANNLAWIDGTTLQFEGASPVCQLPVLESPSSSGFRADGAVVAANGNLSITRCYSSLRVACCGRQERTR